MRSVDSSLNSSVLVSKDLKTQLESCWVSKNIYRSKQSINFGRKESKDPALNPFEPSFDNRFDWLEKEMAKVCGEEGNYEEVFKFPPLGSSCCTEELKFITPYDKCNQSQVVEANSLNQPSQPVKIDWKSLKRKHEAELKRKMEKLEKEGDFQKKARLERRFCELFGPDESTVDAVNGKKDEIAAFTVKHLMPFYKAQRVASKDLFKKLARHISQSMIEEKSSADEKDVQTQIQEFFKDGKMVTSDHDIYSC